MLKRFLKKRRFPYQELNLLYCGIGDHCRDPKFYTDHGVADDLNGRYNLIILHLFLVMQKLGLGSDEAQALFDIFFKDMDRNLRENGVGDLAVPKRMKKMIHVFYEQVQHYEAAFDNGDLEKAINQIFFDGQEKGASIVCYTQANKERLDAFDQNAVISGFQFEF